MSRFGNDAPEHREQSAKALATVLHLHRGTPYVYQGDELGLPNAGFTRIDQLRDIESLNHYATAVAAGQDPAAVMAALSAKGRDNARVPMPWDDSPTGGFTTGYALDRRAPADVDRSTPPPRSTTRTRSSRTTSG